MLQDLLKGIKEKTFSLQDFIQKKMSATVYYSAPQVEEEKPIEEPVALPKLEGGWIGTNYDPYDVDQNRPDADKDTIGIGATGIKIGERMVAVSRKPNSDEAMVRLGTVLRDPETREMYLVADLMNRRFDGQNKIDFATPKSGKVPNEKYNKTFEGLEIVREGKGYEDARSFVESGEWQKMLTSSGVSKEESSDD